MAVSTGQTAPDATLFMTPKETARISDFRGRPVVLLFFPLAFSGVCTEEMCSMAEDYSAYASLGAEVIGISVDSPYTNQKFAEACNATFPIASDFNREATRAFGVLRPTLGIGLENVSERAAFVLAGNGEVVYSWVGENPGVMPDFNDIRAAVEKLKG